MKFLRLRNPGIDTGPAMTKIVKQRTKFVIQDRHFDGFFNPPFAPKNFPI